MHVRVSGPAAAPCVLLLHGHLLGGEIYDALAARLAARHRVLVPDLPGYGESPRLVPFSYEAVQDALLAELEARGIRRASMVGYSQGAYHALALALSGRLEVERLALLGPLAGLDAPAKQLFRDLAAGLDQGLDVGAAFVAGAAPPEWAAEHPEQVAAVRAAASATSRETLRDELLASAELRDLRPRLGEVRVPVLLRVGALDRNTPAAHSEEIARALPDARSECVPGVGHLYLQQDLEGTVASVEAFLVEGGGGGGAGPVGR